MAKTLAGWVSNLPHTFSSLQGVARDMDDSSENVGQDGIHWYLHKLGDAFSRLCRLMCGRFSTSRVGLQLSSGLCPKSRAGGHSPEENWRHPLREVENLPHIRRHSREKHLQANPSSSPTRYQARRRQRPSTLSRRPCPVFLLFRVPRIAPLRRN